MRVVCVGDCGIDLYLPSGERRFGGITANVARHAAELFPEGDAIHVVSAVGKDDRGRAVLDWIGDDRIDWYLPVLDGATPVQTIEIEPDGERRFTHYEEGVLATLRFDDRSTELIATSDLLIAPVFRQVTGTFGRLMKIGRRGQAAIDFADFREHPDFDLLERHAGDIDVAFFGLRETDGELIERIAAVVARTGRLFIVTLGPAGSLAFDGTMRVHCDAVPVDAVVDTTGAGDAYAAAFLATYLHGAGLEEAMRHGAARAASVIRYAGAYRRGT